IKLPLREQVNAEAIKQEAVLWEQASGHPNVLPIIEADEYDGQILIVSEYAAGGTLDDLLEKEGALPTKKAIEIAIGILNGLEFLHSRQIIHRDIKPANILLQGEIPRLTDFGLSRAVSGNSLSMSISINGTPYYMSPEAFNRKRNQQTDIWSFGVVLYKMVTGKLPLKAMMLPNFTPRFLAIRPLQCRISFHNFYNKLFSNLLLKFRQNAMQMRLRCAKI
ncbi:MAG TPA: serine/threonine-protein kinase, partial [Pyrinomonadaceae bacterium]|nr:serine/threonine-protein kinase [Pyrinomonadaceae bacterium]